MNIQKHRYQLMLDLVSKNGLVLEFSSEQEKDDFSLVQAASLNNYKSLKYASNRLRNDKKILLSIIEQEKTVPFDCIGEQLREELYALKEDVSIIEYLQYCIKKEYSEFLDAQLATSYSYSKREKI